jgi:hypothetical protein
VLQLDDCGTDGQLRCADRELASLTCAIMICCGYRWYLSQQDIRLHVRDQLGGVGKRPQHFPTAVAATNYDGRCWVGSMGGMIRKSIHKGFLRI